MNYRPRIADKLLENKLKGMGAVLVEGAKWCGKTTTGLIQTFCLMVRIQD